MIDALIKQGVATGSASLSLVKGSTESGDGRKLLRIPAFAFLYLLGHAEKNGYKGME